MAEPLLLPPPPHSGAGADPAPAPAPDLAPPPAAEPPPGGWPKRLRAAGAWLWTEGPKLLVWGSFLALAGAVLSGKVSPGHPFNVIAHQQETLKQEQEKFKREQADWQFAQEMAETHVQLGERLLKAGQFKDAARAFAQAQTLDATNTDAAWGLIRADIYADSASGDYDPEVVRMRLDLVLERHPEKPDPVALSQMGTLVALQDPAAAESWLERALAQDADLPLAHYGLGILLMDQGQPGAAALHLERAVELSPWNLDAVDNLAYVRLHRGEIDQARRGYERALDLDGERLSLYLGLAETERLAGHWKSALGNQEALVRLLENEKVHGQEKNQVVWHFPAAQGSVTITDPAAKRSLSLALLALDRHLTGDTAGAWAAMLGATGAAGLAPEVRTLLRRQIGALREAQPGRAVDLDRFIARYLRAAPGGKAPLRRG